MLIKERAGRPVLVDELGVEVRPREAVAFEGEVYYLGWVDGDRAALIGDLRLLPVPPTRRPLVDLLIRPERLSRPGAAGSDWPRPSTFPEFAHRMEVILHDIIELAGAVHDAIGSDRLVSDLVCSIGTRTFNASDLLREYEEGVTRGVAALPPEAPVPGTASHVAQPGGLTA
jgi:hypothetical protein